ncbi:unnamed protein product [Rhodiola kirilowii]
MIVGLHQDNGNLDYRRREKWKAWVAMNNMPGIEFMDEGLPTAAELETERIAYCCKTRDRKVSLS